MKKIVVLLTLSICYFITTSESTGPGLDGYELTGAENGYGNATKAGCTCHSSTAASSIKLNLELDSMGTPTSHYTGGMSYIVKITGTNNDSFSYNHFGFQITSMEGLTPIASPINAGTWDAPFPTNTHFTAPVIPYYKLGIVEHSAPLAVTTGNGGKGSTYSQTFNWTAPGKGTGTISIWAVLNAIHTIGSLNTIDKWDTSHIVLKEWAPTIEVNVTEQNKSTFQIYPNPASEKVNVVVSENATIQLIDMEGSVVISLNVYANQKQVISTENLANGVYTLKVANANFIDVKKVVIAK
jgi:Secretion system C-terminal sorting domain